MIEGIKYFFIRVQDDKIVYGKKKNNGAVTLQRSKSGKLCLEISPLSFELFWSLLWPIKPALQILMFAAIVIAKTGEGLQQGACNKGVAVVAEYFEGMGM